MAAAGAIHMAAAAAVMMHHTAIIVMHTAGRAHIVDNIIIIIAAKHHSISIVMVMLIFIHRLRYWLAERNPTAGKKLLFFYLLDNLYSKSRMICKLLHFFFIIRK